jgi:hypothetical protein
VPDLPATVPADLVAIVHKAMAKDPADRYADGAELAAALRGQAPAPRVPPVPPPADATRVMTGVAAAPVAAAAVVPPPTERTPVNEDSGSRWLLYAVVALAVVVVVLLLLFRPWQNDNATPDPTPSKQSPTPSSTPSPSPTESASPSDSPSPSPTASATPQVTIDPDAYLGKSADQARSQLRAMGMQTTTQTVDNPGDQDEGTVAGVSPTGQVDKGSTITLQVYGPAPDSGDNNGSDSGSGGNSGEGG